MSILLHGDCIELLDTLDDHSVDFIYCDFPYATERFGTCTSCEWDKPIDLEKWWGKILKKKKINTPIFMSCNVKLGCELIRTAPKKCPFRYDLIWVKSTPCGFLSAKKMPMRKHELIYVFYEKLPLYDLSSHTHTFTKERDTAQKNGKIYEGKGNKKIMEGGYSPPLPVSVIKGENNTYNTEGRNKPITREPAGKYNPPLPTSLLEVKSTRGSHSTEKPTDLIKWLLKYYSKEGDVVLDCTMGSGSTGVACKEMNRNFIGFELNPEIYEVAVNRIEG